MIKNEKVYLGFSIMIALATLTLFLPENIFNYFWEKGHDGPILILFWAVFSLILGIIGISKIFKAKREKRNIRALSIATFMATSFFIVVACYIILFKINRHWFS